MNKHDNEIKMTDLNSKIKHAIISIEGTSDLVLNKMNARNTRALMAADRKQIREIPNVWEDLITAIHWRDPLPMTDTYTQSTAEMMAKLLNENAPCITAFGLKKSFGQTVVRTGTDKYSTSFDASLNITSEGGLVPVKFATWRYTEQLMSPKRGAPVTVDLNHFIWWSAQFQIDYLEGVYTRDKLIDIINLAGFSIGIGSGRTSGYGRYKVTAVEVLG